MFSGGVYCLRKVLPVGCLSGSIVWDDFVKDVEKDFANVIFNENHDLLESGLQILKILATSERPLHNHRGSLHIYEGSCPS